MLYQIMMSKLFMGMVHTLKYDTHIGTTRYFKQTNMLGENQLKMYIILIKY